MESLSSFDLIILCVDVDFCIKDETAQRFIHANRYLSQRLKTELHSRPHAEVLAAMQDIRRIEPELKPMVDAMAAVFESLKRVGL